MFLAFYRLKNQSEHGVESLAPRPDSIKYCSCRVAFTSEMPEENPEVLPTADYELVGP